MLTTERGEIKDCKREKNIIFIMMGKKYTMGQIGNWKIKGLGDGVDEREEVVY